MSASLQLHGLQHTRSLILHHLPELAHSCPLSWWWHPTILSCIIPLSSCLQSFQWASGAFPVSQPFASGGQSIGASASVLSVNIQDWFPLRGTGWISLQSKGLSRVFSNTTVQRHQFFSAQLSLCIFVFFFKFIYSNCRLITLQYCSGFAIHWHESAMSAHVFPILSPASSCLPIPSVWVIPVHQHWAPCLMHRTRTGNLFHIW